MEVLVIYTKKKLCHLDIKPENIIVDTYTRNFKLIDFGFTSMEPFDEFIKYPRGTLGYFPDIFDPKDVKLISPKFILMIW